MLKQKCKISFISILLSLLLLPVFFPVDLPFHFSIEGLLDSYFQSLLFYIVYGTIFMITIGVPVNFLAGTITKSITKFTHIINLLIHVIPAFLFFSPLLFLFSLQESLLFIGMAVFSASIFFVVDEIIYHKINLKTRRATLLYFVPLLTYLTFTGPSFVQILDNNITSAQIEKKGRPIVTAIINGEEIKINSSYSWSSHGGGEVYDTDPYLIHPKNGMDDIYFTDPLTSITFNFDNNSGQPEFYAYYYENNEKKKVKIVDSTIELPNNIPSQLVKFVATWDNHERISFVIGVSSEE
ncbi:hypothetical protein LC087_16200 [Bacillus carboniphilus]|uniref:Uncharacterized protein n=1 Tax=Bacillus carboniphilus TaxID=86663 RepID=A0ABY9JUT5_9BACI|nr:hypothetical protein [Bacillus carboniphilus]WLR42253.1 hypothetical protein LC087_16200 [Bacillus carboniphilus]